MKEQAVNLAYKSALKNGYKGDRDSFLGLISTNDKALQVSLNEAKSNGFSGGLDEFRGILGIKEQEKEDPSFMDGSVEQQEQPAEPSKENGVSKSLPKKTKTTDKPTPLLDDSLVDRTPEDLSNIQYTGAPKVSLSIKDREDLINQKNQELTRKRESLESYGYKLMSENSALKEKEAELLSQVESGDFNNQEYRQKYSEYQSLQQGLEKEKKKYFSDLKSFNQKSLDLRSYNELTNIQKEIKSESVRKSINDFKSSLPYGGLDVDLMGGLMTVGDQALAGLAGQVAQMFTPDTEEEIIRKASTLSDPNSREILINNLRKEKERVSEIKSNLIEYANKRSEASEKRGKTLGLVQQLGQIDMINSPMDGLRYAVHAAAEGAAQIPLAVATYGGSSFIMTSGLMYQEVYNQEVERLKQSGLSEEEAKKKALLDENVNKIGLNLGAGLVAALDLMGSSSVLGKSLTNQAKKKVAKEVLDNFVSSGIYSGAKQFGKGVRSEVLTENIQEAIEAETKNLVTGGELGEGVKEITVEDYIEISTKTILGLGAPSVITALNTKKSSSDLVKAIDSDPLVERFIFEQIDAKVNDDKMTVEEGDFLKGEINADYKSYQSIKKLIPESKIEKAIPLQRDYEAVSEQIKETSGALVPFLKEKQKELQEQLISLTTETDAKTVEELRSEEQSEMLREIPNAEEALTNGKVDRDELSTDEDKAKFDEIYSKYDKLISPLTEEGADSRVEPLELEYKESDVELGLNEVSSIKEGSTTTKNPVRIFKGIGGKKDLKGQRINAHEGVDGVFSSVDKDVADEYGREDGVSEVVIPKGTSVEVVQIDTKGLSPKKYRELEVEAINNSKAQVVKLITLDGKIKRGSKSNKQEQYIIKDESLINELGKVNKEEMTDTQRKLVDEADTLGDNEVKSYVFNSLEEVPAALRGNAKKQEATEVEVKKGFFGKTEKVKTREDVYILTVSGKELRDLKSKEQKTKEKVEDTSTKTLSETDKKSIAEKVGRTRKVKAKNVSGLIDVMAGIFGLNKNQAENSAVVGDVIIGNAAKRAGISKDEMYQKIAFAKAQMEDLPQGVKFQVDAWHGSPYQFDKFTTGKIGTGEGAQAFGWGLYFTDLESIARNYAKNLANYEIKINGKTLDVNHPLFSYTQFIINNNGNVDAILNELQEIESQEKPYIKKGVNDQSFKRRRKAIEFLKNNPIIEVEGDRNLYKVTLHKGKTPDQYTWLEWDKPVSEKKVGLVYDQWIKEFGSVYTSKRKDGKVLSFDRMLSKGSNLYDELLSQLGTKEASLFLLRAGIDGIKYPAESIARGATSDTARGFNYVVFDENAVSIEEVIKFQKDAEKVRGAMMMAMDNQAIIYALTDPNVSTPLHELAHVYEHYLTDKEKADIESWSGHKSGTVEFSEAFARGFEKFLSKGKTSNPKLKSIFSNFANWLIEIYNGIKGSDIDLKLNKKMKSIYDQMLLDDPKIDKIYDDSNKAISGKARKLSIRDRTRLIREKLLDRQTRVKDLIKGISSKEARRSMALLVTKAGAGGYANFRFKKADKKIYDGLSKSERATLDKIIYVRRIISINENRKKDGRDLYVGKENYSGGEASLDLQKIEANLGAEKFLDLSNRADEYFSVFDESLKRMRDSKLISEEVYNNLKDYEYSPIKTIKYLIPEGTVQDDIDRIAIATGVTSDAIKKLGDSNQSDVIMDSRWLLMTNLSMVEGIVFENRLLDSFSEAIDSATDSEKQAIGEYVLDNPVVETKVDKDGNKVVKRKYDLNKIPIGFRKVSFKKDGVDKYMVIQADYANQLLDIKNKPGSLEKVIPKLTGTKVLRFFATSGNPLFIVGNTAVDFQNILFLSDVYSNNKFFGGFQLAFDFLKSTFGKVFSMNKYNKSYEEFMVHGGSIDYLSADGLQAIKNSLWSDNKLIDAGAKLIKGYGGFMSYLGETSEIAFRIAVFEKSKANQIKQFKKENKSDPNEQDMEDIMFEAAREARETIDFNQGGSMVKSADKTLPYLNAATQGLRKAVDYSAKNPKQFASNMIQLALMSGTTFAASLFMLFRGIGDDEDEKEKVIQTLNSISEYEKANYYILFNGKRREDGEFEYYRIKKLPQVAAVSTIAEQLVLKAVLKSKGIDYDFDVKTVQKSLKSAAPIIPTPKEILQRNPAVSAFITYSFNEDLFYDKEIFKAPGGKKIDPIVEGIHDPKVNQIYKDIAPAIGMSPIRSKAAMEKIITSETTNPMIGLFYSGYDALMKENTPMADDLSNAFDKLVGNSSKKLVRYTNKNLIKYKERADLELQETVIETDIYKKEQEIYNEIKSVYEDGESMNIEDIKSLVKDKFEKRDWEKYVKKYSNFVSNRDVDKSMLDIIYEDTPEVQALMIFNRYGDSFDNEEKLELLKSMKSARRRISSKTMSIYKEKYLK